MLVLQISLIENDVTKDYERAQKAHAEYEQFKYAVKTMVG